MAKKGLRRPVRAVKVPVAQAEDRLAAVVREVLAAIGEDPNREGLLKTPERVAKSWRELTCGYNVDVRKLLNNAVFKAPESDMVVVTGINFYSLCEHHLLPFHGKCSVAYVPNGKIIGLSKIPRLI
jgi:GTP cyclohydrolase I